MEYVFPIVFSKRGFTQGFYSGFTISILDFDIPVAAADAVDVKYPKSIAPRYLPSDPSDS